MQKQCNSTTELIHGFGSFGFCSFSKMRFSIQLESHSLSLLCTEKPCFSKLITSNNKIKNMKMECKIQSNTKLKIENCLYIEMKSDWFGPHSDQSNQQTKWRRWDTMLSDRMQDHLVIEIFIRLNSLITFENNVIDFICHRLWAHTHAHTHTSIDRTA